MESRGRERQTGWVRYKHNKPARPDLRSQIHPLCATFNSNPFVPGPGTIPQQVPEGPAVLFPSLHPLRTISELLPHRHPPRFSANCPFPSFSFHMPRFISPSTQRLIPRIYFGPSNHARSNHHGRYLLPRQHRLPISSALCIALRLFSEHSACDIALLRPLTIAPSQILVAGPFVRTLTHGPCPVPISPPQIREIICPRAWSYQSSYPHIHHSFNNPPISHNQPPVDSSALRS